MAIDSIRKNKLRSSLTLLGISIGVFSVIGVMTAIRTLESSVESGLNVFATNTFVIQKYPGISFGSERRKHRNRKNIIYAGSNSGVLHAIDADTGEEERAFVPPFIEAGDEVIVDTRTLEYVKRVN